MSDESITVENCFQFMEKQKASKDKKLIVEKSKSNRSQSAEEDQFDFGGFPKGRDLKKNLGCGG